MIAEEHLATQILRTRLLALTHGARSVSGASALLACAPGEHHDIGLVMLAVALERRGWQVTLLGANTPIDALAHACERLEPDCAVLSVTIPQHAAALACELDRIAALRSLVLAGPGAVRLEHGCGATLLTGDPISAAASITELACRESLRPQSVPPASA